MLIIQKGMGAIIYLVGFLGLIIPPLITRLTISDPYFATNNYWIMGTGLMISGIIDIRLGKKFDQRDEKNRKKHHFFFLNFREWGFIFLIIGFLTILVFLKNLFLRVA